MMIMTVNYLIIHTRGVKKKALQIRTHALHVVIIAIGVRSKFVLFVERLC